MSNMDIIRAWKDQAYREKLNQEQRALLPDHPAGELSDADLEAAVGGGGGGRLASPPQTVTVNGEICCCDSVCICVRALRSSAYSARVSGN